MRAKVWIRWITRGINTRSDRVKGGLEREGKAMAEVMSGAHESGGVGGGGVELIVKRQWWEERGRKRGKGGLWEGCVNDQSWKEEESTRLTRVFPEQKSRQKIKNAQSKCMKKIMWQMNIRLNSIPKYPSCTQKRLLRRRQKTQQKHAAAERPQMEMPSSVCTASTVITPQLHTPIWLFFCQTHQVWRDPPARNGWECSSCIFITHMDHSTSAGAFRLQTAYRWWVD